MKKAPSSIEPSWDEIADKLYREALKQRGEIKGRILIVDDEEAIRKIISIWLTAAGYQCQAVASGRRAMALLSKRKFDLVTTDIARPRDDGITLLKRIKKKYPKIPVLIVSASPIAIRQKCLRLGAYDYLQKPFFEREQLLATVRRVAAR